MRLLSQAAIDKVTQPNGTEPVNVLIISWIDGIWSYYVDTDYGEISAAGVSPALGFDGLILNLSNLESLPDLDGKASSLSLNVTLNDTEGKLKNIIDTVDIHKRPVRVAQWYKGIELQDAFVLFEGVVSSPITWSEGDRTLKFDIVSILESREVGFSIEEGDFDYVPPHLVGRAWPYIFGTVFKVPALRVQNSPKGVSSKAFSDSRVKQSNRSNASASNVRAMNEALMRADESFAHAIEIRSGEVNFLRNVGGSDEPTTFNTTYQINVHEYISENAIRASVKTFSISGTLADYERAHDDYFKRGNDYLIAAEQAGFASIETSFQGSVQSDSAIQVANGEEFPQNTPIQIAIGGFTYTGTFSGRAFTINGVSNVSRIGVIPASRVSVADDYVSTQYIQQIPGDNNFVIDGGAIILLGSNSGYTVDYIACLDYCQVLAVWAKRTINGQSLMWLVPSIYYSVQQVNFGTNFGDEDGNPLNAFDVVLATKIVMSTPLSSRTDPAGNSEGWSDDIFIDLASPYGNNAVDAMKILIQKYTNATWDDVSFDQVRTLQIPYPIGGALTDRRDVLTVLKEMAFQMRCNIRYNNGKFYLRYLSLNSPFVGSINNDDIERASLEITCDDTENLITKLVAKWKLDLSGDNDQVQILRHNIIKYGTHEQTFDFWLYNIGANVNKSAVFWMIRRSNTYKILKFNTFMSKLNLEANDYIQVTVPDSHDGTVIGMVESCVYDSSKSLVSMQVWLPVRMGERTEYPFAMPSDLSPLVQFPTRQALHYGEAGTGSIAGGNVLSTDKSFYGFSSPHSPHADRGSNIGRLGDFLSPTFNAGPSDIGNVPQAYPQGLLPGDITRTLDTGSQSSPVNVSMFTIKPVPSPGGAASEGGSQMYPAFVQGNVGGRIYTVDAYLNGLEGTVTELQAEQIGLAEGNVIERGTPTMIFKMTIRGRAKYYMQVPVWAGPE